MSCSLSLLQTSTLNRYFLNKFEFNINEKMNIKMSLPIEIINKILYEFNGLEHPVSTMIKNKINNIYKELVNEESFWDCNEFYNIDEQIEYISGCEEYTNFKTNYGSILLWKSCINNYNYNNNNTKIIYNIDLEDEEFSGFLKTNFINEQDDRYENIGFSKA